MTAQKTTTKRSQITISQQLRWHTTIETAWETLTLRNKPTEEFNKLKKHFTGNLDESCVMGNDQNVRVLSAVAKKKYEMNTDDYRGSISTVWMDNAAGNSGPLFLLASGKKKKLAVP